MFERDELGADPGAVKPLLAILERLVELPTVSGNLAACEEGLDFIGEFLAERGLVVRRFDQDGFGALVATVRPTLSPAVMLTAHLDVVPGPEHLFTLKRDGARAIGRGVFDMKGAIAAYLTLVDELGPDLGQYDFGVMITTDEETRDLGVKLLLQEELYRPRVAVLPDGGDNWQLEEVAKGAWRVRVSTYGVPVHGSRPWTGESASFKLLDLLGDIRRRFPIEDPHVDTLNISFLRAGTAPNQLPDQAEAVLDIRVMGPAELAAVERDVAEICRRHGADLELLVLFPPVKHDLADPLLAEFARSVERVTGVTCGSCLSFGSSDAAQFATVGVPCAVTRPIGGGHHGDEEWVDVASLSQLVPVLRDYLTRVAHSPR
ncbi:acetylornithine deacetylase/succinyldiaminopimelate desuccinylase-like deacylase [Cryptosporangium arvum DSM 44712]|uniref:Acetylornithine deacetylase/succinyldiaminopimelate desuccinylase-like deacylase n=1 Tax=Cryptosporangium arvum DSM 44712 TaxID=927661 RepID=A0A010YGN0_9ACTN|nr:acetylornithine deacetylase/succinyldiaminopimelate desuccinylase-like deacylase [Cryptosporangium arvum DSM 44712]